MAGPYRLFSWSLIRYVTRDVVLGFFSGTTIFLLIMLMFQVIRLSDFVVVHQVGAGDMGRLATYLMLSFFPIAIPVAFLFAVMMSISRANSEGEILALQVNGISLKQAFLPILGLSFLVSGISLYTSLYTVPQGNRNFELLITQLGSERVMSTIKPGVFIEGFYGLVLFAERIEPVQNKMQRVFIYDNREGAHPLVITAKGGRLKQEQAGQRLTLRLSDGTIHVDRRDDSPLIQKINFELYDINLETAETGQVWRAFSPPSYTYPQLKQKLVDTLPDPPTHRKLLVEMHRRFSLSLSCIVFAALGFFIGISSQRGVRSTSILICLGVGLVYWLCYLIANALAAEGTVPPWLGMWVPNFLFLGLAVWFARRYGRV